MNCEKIRVHLITLCIAILFLSLGHLQSSSPGVGGWKAPPFPNCTLVDGQTFSITPHSGASPVRQGNGKYAGMELFKQEQELSLKLVNSLSASQKQQAEVGSGNGPEAVSRVSWEEYENMAGIPFLDLTEEQQNCVEQIVLLFAEKYRPEIAEQINNRKKIFDPSTLRFSYIFSSRGYVAYFCIITRNISSSLITRGGNHIHAVWLAISRGDFWSGFVD